MRTPHLSAIAALALLILGPLAAPLPLSAASLNLTATVQSAYVCGNNIKEPGEQCDGADLGGAMCSTSGFTGGMLGCSNSCQFVFSSCTTDAGSAVITDFPVTGGTYSFDNGDPPNSTVTLIVPGNSYPETLTLEAFPYAPAAVEPTRPSPAGTDFVGMVYSMYFLSADGGVVPTLNEPVTVTLPYNNGEVSGLDPSTFTVYSMTQNGNSWQAIPGAVVDTADQTVTFTTESFGQWFTIFGQPLPPAPPAPSNGSGSSGSSGLGGQSSVSGGISVSGTAPAGSTVVLLVDSERLASVIAASDGSFSLARSLLPGTYTLGLYEEAGPNGPRSPLQNIQVTVQAGTVSTVDGVVIAAPAGLPPANPSGLRPSHGDVNGDGRVDLVDFSILAYWFGRPRPPAGVDQNGDGKIDLTDFSIMAYYWTG